MHPHPRCACCACCAGCRYPARLIQDLRESAEEAAAGADLAHAPTSLAWLDRAFQPAPGGMLAGGSPGRSPSGALLAGAPCSVHLVTRVHELHGVHGEVLVEFWLGVGVERTAVPCAQLLSAAADAAPAHFDAGLAHFWVRCSVGLLLQAVCSTACPMPSKNMCQPWGARCQWRRRAVRKSALPPWRGGVTQRRPCS